MPKKRIAYTVGLNRRTVSTWLAAGHFPERLPRARQLHRLDPYADYILERYDAGLDNAAQLARELRERGYTGPDQTVSRYLVELRRTRPRGTPGPLPPRGSAPVPSPRETAWLLRNADAKPETLAAEERAYVAALDTQCPELARARALTEKFVQMLEHHDASALDPWLAAAEASELRSFATGLRRDHDAVLAAVLFPWSNGQVEGHVNRVKLLKRSMYGRASFALLRKRVLRAA
jgi:transposase